MNKDANNNSDEGDTEINGSVGEVFIYENSNVNKHIKHFQSRIDETNEREKNRETQRIEKLKNLEDREGNLKRSRMKN
eukprot:15842659-Heterocapsa_arctica.AAC.1